MSVDAGKVVEITAPVTGTSTTTHGFLSGSGTFETYPDPLSTSGVVFTHLTSLSSVTIDMVQSHDSFVDFNDGGTLNVAPGLDADSGGVTTITFNGFTIDSTGSVEILADPSYIGTHVNASNFQSSGTLTIDPAAVGSGYRTLLQNVGPAGTPTDDLYFGNGSKTYIGTPETAVYPSDWPDTSLRGQQTFVAGIDLNDNDLVVTGTSTSAGTPPVYTPGALFVNNGFVASSAGSPTVYVDGTGDPLENFINGPHGTATTHGALYKGAGFKGVSLVTQNGGLFQAGNSPGSDAVGQLVLGPGGVEGYVFCINDATGMAGPSPDANGQVSGWGLVNVDGNLTWSADAAHKLVVNLLTLANPTTVGFDVAGSMDHFDPSQSNVWEAVHWTGTYTGPTDSATL
jgi:hypothetical protein